VSAAVPNTVAPTKQCSATFSDAGGGACSGTLFQALCEGARANSDPVVEETRASRCAPLEIHHTGITQACCKTTTLLAHIPHGLRPVSNVLRLSQCLACVLQYEVANSAAAIGADGNSAVAGQLDAVLHVPRQYQVLPA
jgi:hypothetical protein